MSLRSFRDDLPDGAFFTNGEFFRALLDELIRDRARLGYGSGEELATPEGRFFNILQSDFAESLGSSGDHAWRTYASPFVGEGTAPADQARRLRVSPGMVANLMPSNMYSELLLPSGAGKYAVCVRVSTTTDAVGTPLSALMLIQTVADDELPEDPAGTEGHSPSYFTRAVAIVDWDGTKITAIAQLHKASLDVAAVVIDVGCGTSTKQFFCGSQINDPLEIPG